MSAPAPEVVWSPIWEDDVTPDEHAAPAVLFSRCFPRSRTSFTGFRSWSSGRPELRLIGRDSARIVAHLGILRRFLQVDGRAQLVGDVGLVAGLRRGVDGAAGEGADERLAGRAGGAERAGGVALLRYDFSMSDTIAQRQLRNDNAEIMRRVEAGESFVITRNGKPIADLTPHGPAHQTKRFTLREQQEHARTLPPIDVERWYADRAADDLIFGDDRLEY